MTRFTLVIMDDEHAVLATEEQLDRYQVEQASEAFKHWRDQGGALIISECLVIDRKPIQLELDLSGVTSDIAVVHPGPAMSSPAQAPEDTPDVRADDDRRGFLGAVTSQRRRWNAARKRVP